MNPGPMKPRPTNPGATIPGATNPGATSAHANNARTAEVRRLWRDRPRNRFRAGSLWFAVGLVAVVMATSGFEIGINARRLANFDRFLGQVVPYPLQGRPFDWDVALDWAAGILRDGGAAAAIATLAMSIVAIVLAMGIGSVLALPAARNLAHPEPFAPGPRPPSSAHAWTWRAVTAVSRGVLMVLRAIPEYVWAFLLVSILGLNAWPAILALALHSAGILGRLASELVEDTDPSGPRALRALGAGRGPIVVASVLPQTFARLLLYFFYRWETCLREATVLGMLGIASLGFLIDNAKVTFEYDEMFFFILVGGAIVAAGDMVSMLARRAVR